MFIANINESYEDVDSVFYVRAAQQFLLTKTNILEPLIIDLSAVVGTKQVSKKVTQIIEEREYINPADFPGVK